ncbi:MAG: extracellular solute-binding protein, partial [Clostridiales bacterium]|nr:extracellular solute-binding protein [Clostridiales bacterium]
MKRIARVLAALLVLALLAACASKDPAPAQAPAAPAAPAGAHSGIGLDGVRFTDTRHITVEIFDRNNEGGSTPADNCYTDFIKQGMLEKHNVEVEFIPVPRWTEGADINNMLAAGTAPDICVTYSAPTIQLYAAMGGVKELAPYLDEAKDILPNLFDFLGDTGIYWSKDPDTGELYAIESKRANVAKQTTFIRNDWLDTLGLAVPNSEEEFHAALVAFRDNAATLLPNEPDKMIPLLVTYDVGWIAAPLINAYIPDALTDKQLYTLGFDDRFLLFPGYKDAIRKLNEWYNEGLIWKDFALYGAGDTTNELLSKAGYVGAQMQNWDQLYRNGEDSVITNIRRATGNDKAGYIALNPFPNDSGKVRTFPY